MLTLLPRCILGPATRTCFDDGFVIDMNDDVVDDEASSRGQAAFVF